MQDQVDAAAELAVRAVVDAGLARRCRPDEAGAVRAYIAALCLDGYRGERDRDPEADPAGAVSAATGLGDAFWDHPSGERLWLLDAAGDRAGFVELGPWGRCVQVHQLYVRPRWRGQGLGGAALRHAAATAEQNGAGGLSVRTQWTWPRAWRAYRAMGLWLQVFKRDLTFLLVPSYGVPCVHEDGDRLEIAVRASAPMPCRHGARSALAWARRDGDHVEVGCDPGDLYGRVMPSTALCFELAVRGWPMWRDPVPEHIGADAGLAPEALALRLRSWTQYARSRGWVVPDDVPRPGVPASHERAWELT